MGNNQMPQATSDRSPNFGKFTEACRGRGRGQATQRKARNFGTPTRPSEQAFTEACDAKKAMNAV
jgi:hypothetical protein